MPIKPQDVVILAKLISYDRRNQSWSQSSMAYELCLSASQISYSLQRLQTSRLICPDFRNSEKKFLPITQLCEEFLIHGVKFAFPPEFGTLTRGIPTGYAAPSLNNIIVPGNDPIPVWPHAEGTHKGIELTPFHPCVPKSIIKYPDPFFYDLLSLLDAIRSGRARERNIGAEKISKMLKEKQAECRY